MSPLTPATRFKAPPGTGSVPEVREHSEDAAVVLGAGGQAELREDARHVLLDGPLGHDQALRDPGVRATLGHQAQHLSLAGVRSASGSSPRRRPTSWETTDGSSADPPSATRRTAAANSCTSETRSLRR